MDIERPSKFWQDLAEAHQQECAPVQTNFWQAARLVEPRP